MNGNGNNKPWGQITEIDRDEVPPRGASIWWDLYLELRSALKDMDPNGSKKIPFESLKEAQSAQHSLRHYFDKSDPTICLSVQKTNGGATIFVFYDRPPLPSPKIEGASDPQLPVTRKPRNQTGLIPFESDLS